MEMCEKARHRVRQMTLQELVDRKWTPPHGFRLSLRLPATIRADTSNSPPHWKKSRYSATRPTPTCNDASTTDATRTIQVQIFTTHFLCGKMRYYPVMRFYSHFRSHPGISHQMQNIFCNSFYIFRLCQ